MQIGNPLVNIAPPTVNAEQRQSQRQTQQALEQPTQTQQASAPVQEFVRVGEARQVERLQAINENENISFRNKDALEQFLAVEDSARSPDEGESIGVDILV